MDGRKWNNEERAVKRTYMAKFVVMQVCFIVTSGVNLHRQFLEAVITTADFIGGFNSFHTLEASCSDSSTSL